MPINGKFFCEFPSSGQDTIKQQDFVTIVTLVMDSELKIKILLSLLPSDVVEEAIFKFIHPDGPLSVYGS